MKKFKKIIAMGCAAVMAMSVMSMSAFAVNNSDELMTGTAIMTDENGTTRTVPFSLSVPTNATLEEEHELIYEAASEAVGIVQRASTTLMAPRADFYIPENAYPNYSSALVNNDPIVLERKYNNVAVVLTNISGNLNPQYQYINARVRFEDKSPSDPNYDCYFTGNNITYGRSCTVKFINNSSTEGGFVNLYSGAELSFYLSAENGSGTATVSITGSY